MKVTDIAPGFFYSDGKQGVREVLAVSTAESPAVVRYRIVAAKQEQEYSWKEQATVSLLDTTASCQLDSFAVWAKKRYDEASIQALLLELKAAKIKLSPGEKLFVQAIEVELGDRMPTPGTRISFDYTEARAVSGLAKKGVVTRHEGEVELTDLGVALLCLGRNQVEKAVLSAMVHPMDAYQVARATGLTPMEVGRAIVDLANAGKLRWTDAAGSSNTLADKAERV